MQVLQNLRISINDLQEFWIRDTQPMLPFYQDVFGKLYRSSVICVSEQLHRLNKMEKKCQSSVVTGKLGVLCM